MQINISIVLAPLQSHPASPLRAMNYIFHQLIGRIVEMYIDDVVVNSNGYEEQLTLGT
jgi:hypothetical protein